MNEKQENEVKVEQEVKETKVEKPKKGVPLIVILILIVLAAVAVFGTKIFLGDKEEDTKTEEKKDKTDTKEKDDENVDPLVASLSKEERELYSIVKFESTPYTSTYLMLGKNTNANELETKVKSKYLYRMIHDSFVNLKKETDKYEEGKIIGYYKESEVKKAYEKLFGTGTYKPLEWIEVGETCPSAEYNKTTKRYEQIKIADCKGNVTLDYKITEVSSKTDDNLIITEILKVFSEDSVKPITYQNNYFFNKTTKILEKIVSKRI